MNWIAGISAAVVCAIALTVGLLIGPQPSTGDDYKIPTGIVVIQPR